MVRFTLRIDDREYPCYQTLGAMLRFSDLRGKDASKFDPTLYDDMLAMLYCHTQGACSREGIPFTLGFMEFADRLDTDDLLAYNEALQAELEAKKKNKPILRTPLKGNR